MSFQPSPALLDLRAEIDALDQQLAHLLCQRLLMIHRAAPLKPTHDTIRLQDRIEDILAKVTPIADQYGIDRDYLELVFRQLMDESIRREGVVWEALQRKK